MNNLIDVYESAVDEIDDMLKEKELTEMNDSNYGFAGDIFKKKERNLDKELAAFIKESTGYSEYDSNGGLDLDDYSPPFSLHTLSTEFSECESLEQVYSWLLSKLQGLLRADKVSAHSKLEMLKHLVMVLEADNMPDDLDDDQRG